MEERPQRQTKFNAGIAKLERINNLKWNIYEARAGENYPVAFSCLKSFYQELYRRMSVEQVKEYKTYENKITSLFKIIRNQRRIPGKVWDMLISSLDDCESFLNKCEGEFGMDMVDKSTGDDAAEV